MIKMLTLLALLASCTTSDPQSCSADPTYDTSCADRGAFAPTPPNGYACAGSAAPSDGCVLAGELDGSAIWCCPDGGSDGSD